MALVPSAQSTNAATQVELTTLTDLYALKGSVATLQGSARVVLDPNEPLLNQPPPIDEVQLRSILEPVPGGPVRGNFILRDDVHWPADFHTWSMVTTYWNFEKAFSYFKDIYDGRSADELLNARVLYWAAYRDVTVNPKADITDNAVFFSPINAFMVLPFDRLQLVPLSLNLGVIGHEYAHWVFNRRAYGGKALPDVLIAWNGKPAIAYLKALDEGVADFHAYGLTCLSAMGCKSSFLESSENDAKVLADRDFASPDKCMTSDLKLNAMNNPGSFVARAEHYKIGTVIAAVLYQAVAKAASPALVSARLRRMQTALIRAYDDDTTIPGKTRGLRQAFANLNAFDDFTLERIVDIIAGHLTESADFDLRQQFCSQAVDRLKLNCRLDSGPAPSPGNCPRVPNCATYQPVGAQCASIP